MVLHIDNVGCRDLFDYLGQVYYELGMYKKSLEAFKSCKRIVDHYYRHYPQHQDVSCKVLYIDLFQGMRKGFRSVCVSVTTLTATHTSF